MKSKLLLLIAIINIVIYTVHSEVVCSEEELVREILEDLEDNGKLDCLRESFAPNDQETKEQADLREAANWDSDCSFESESEKFPWKTRLQKYYGLTKGLVDVDGNPVDDDFEDQADMCEIIRALVANSNYFT
jgi:hypothetical protein